MQRLPILFILSLIALPTFAEPVTDTRIATLPAPEQGAWRAYLEKSQTLARADQAALDAEVAANALTAALKAPSGGDFKLKKEPGDAWYASDEANTLTASVLSFQTPSGGWSKHLGFTRGPRKPGMLWTSQNLPGEPAHYLATFDNGSTTSEMNLLANVWLATKREDCKAGFIKALAFILAAQYPNGGWPQVFPLEAKYHDDITFNDDAMTHVLELLQGITLNEPSYAFLEESQRKQAAEALARGIDCVLKSQVEVNGTRTVWCAQFDALTLQPSNARKMEPATLSGEESAHVLKFLMTIPHPSPEVVACIESGLKWMAEAKLPYVAATQPEGQPTTAPATGSAGGRWARFYDLKTGKAVFPGRDGVVYPTFELMAEKNRLGYDYFTSQPNSIITNGQKKWRKMLAAEVAK